MDPLAAIIVVVFIAILIIIYIKQSKKSGTQTIANIDLVNKIKEAQLYLDELYQTKTFNTIATDIILKKGEEAYLQDNVSYFEMRSKSISTRGFGAVRIAKGFYVGGSQGQSRSVPELRCIDQGSLILTNKRVIFNGTHLTKEYKIEKILSIETVSGSVCLSCEGKEKKPQFYGIDNVALWKSLIILMKQFSDVKDFPHVLLTASDIDYQGQNNLV